MSNPVYVIYAKHMCSVHIGYPNRMDKKDTSCYPMVAYFTAYTMDWKNPPQTILSRVVINPKHICPDLVVRMRNPNRIGTKGLPSGNRTETALTLRGYPLRRCFLVSASIFLTWLITLNAKMHVQI